jgi:bifunctional DNA-binding transcriptional regulator/antitoxin component of YhaV-PrlF toxin-antitoxin module
MTTLTVTAKGQVILRQELLRHLSVQPGQQIHVITLPGGRIEVRAAQPPGSIEAFIGRLADRSPKVASIAEIQAAATAGRAGEP